MHGQGEPSSQPWEGQSVSGSVDWKAHGARDGSVDAKVEGELKSERLPGILHQMWFRHLYVKNIFCWSVFVSFQTVPVL